MYCCYLSYFIRFLFFIVCLLYVNVRMNMYVMFLLGQQSLNKLLIIIISHYRLLRVQSWIYQLQSKYWVYAKYAERWEVCMPFPGRSYSDFVTYIPRDIHQQIISRDWLIKSTQHHIIIHQKRHYDIRDPVHKRTFDVGDLVYIRDSGTILEQSKKLLSSISPQTLHTVSRQ